MSYQLVIVESSAKSKTIQKYLNQLNTTPFKVVASFGHVVDLPRKTMGVDTNSWDIEYTSMPDKKKTLSELKKLAKDASMVYLASDPDREGEAIAWHLKNELKLKKYQRITFHEITPKAIKDALNHPRDLDQPLIDAQESRRALDRVVGYQVSPLLWRRFATGSLSAGRVQSAVLAEMVHRFKEIQQHQPEKYWILQALFQLFETSLDTKLYEKKGTSIHHFANESDIVKILEHLKKERSWTISFDKKRGKENPGAPYTTSALQQEVYEKYKIPAKQTMSYAQMLYEKGFITYMRTDSVHISQDAKQEIHEYIQEVFDETQVVDREFKSKVANAQEAHECIRPSHLSVLSDALPEECTDGHRKVYNLIWRKAVASQMAPVEYIHYHFTLQTQTPLMKKYEFRGKVSFIDVLGYLQIWQPKQTVQHAEIEKWNSLVDAKEIPLTLEKITGEGNVTKPPSLYNEPNVIKWMEKEGIGRPSTYSNILEKILTKGYVLKGSDPQSTMEVKHYVLEKGTLETRDELLKIGGNDKDRYLPTSLGERVIEYLEQTLPSVLDKDFTSQMEEQLDRISRHETTKKEVLTEFYKPFEVSVQQATAEQKSHIKEDKENTTLAPKQANILRSFEEADILQTRFGPALFVKETKKFVAIVPFQEWKKKEMDDITSEDVQFILRLPMKIEDISIEMGRYGLYLIHEKQNYQLPKEHWDSVYHNTITYNTLKPFLVRKPSTFVKKSFMKKKVSS